MSSVAPANAAETRLRIPREAAAAVFVMAGIATIVLFFLFPVSSARGWLIALSVFSQIVLGSVALLLIHTLTSTTWGRAFGPFLRSFSWGAPLVAVFWIAIAVNLAEIYPWAASPESVPPATQQAYLNPVLYWGRSTVAIAGWNVLAALVVTGTIGRFAAGLGLVFFGVSNYILGIDWIFSTGSPFLSSEFFAEMAIEALLAALAAAALFAPQVEDPQARADLAAFMVTGAAAVFYFAFMALVVYWYGDLPEQARWYLARMGIWDAAIVLALVFGVVVPIAALFWGSVRRSGLALRLVGISVLFGVAAHIVWLLGPILGPLPLGFAAVFGLAMIGALVAAIYWGNYLLDGRRRRYV